MADPLPLDFQAPPPDVQPAPPGGFQPRGQRRAPEPSRIFRWPEMPLFPLEDMGTDAKIFSYDPAKCRIRVCVNWHKKIVPIRGALHDLTLDEKDVAEAYGPGKYAVQIVEQNVNTGGLERLREHWMEVDEQQYPMRPWEVDGTNLPADLRQHILERAELARIDEQGYTPQQPSAAAYQPPLPQAAPIQPTQPQQVYHPQYGWIPMPAPIQQPAAAAPTAALGGLLGGLLAGLTGKDVFEFVGDYFTNATEKAKAATSLEVERMKLEHQARQAEADRSHKLMMAQIQAANARPQGPPPEVLALQARMDQVAQGFQAIQQSQRSDGLPKWLVEVRNLKAAAEQLGWQTNPKMTAALEAAEDAEGGSLREVVGILGPVLTGLTDIGKMWMADRMERNGTVHAMPGQATAQLPMVPQPPQIQPPAPQPLPEPMIPTEAIDPAGEG